MNRWLHPGVMLPIALVAIAWLAPGALQSVAFRLRQELAPLAEPVVWVLILGAGFRMLTRGAKRK